MKLHISLFVMIAATSACSSSSERAQQYREALDEAQLSLADSVGVAEVGTAGGIGLRAALLLESEPVFSVGAMSVDAVKRVRVDAVAGKVLSMEASSEPAEPCPGAVSLTQALAVAEAEVGGEAVAIEPDDDGHCNRAVKVVADDTIWEVKVAPSGAVLETEEDDEAEGDD